MTVMLQDLLEIKNDTEETISRLEQLKNHPQNNFLEIETKNGEVKVLGPGAIHDNLIQEVNK